MTPSGVLCVCGGGGDTGHLQETELRSQQSPDIARTEKIFGTFETHTNCLTDLRGRRKPFFWKPGKMVGERGGGVAQPCLRINLTGVDTLLKLFSRGRTFWRDF